MTDVTPSQTSEVPVTVNTPTVVPEAQTPEVQSPETSSVEEVRRDAPKISVSELYACSQGEGLMIGMPSILVRTSGCNLRCSFRGSPCDTAYTSWDVASDTEKRLMTPQELYNEVVKVATDRKNPIGSIIISGGEPTLWKEITDVVQGLILTGFHVTIETNGTKYIEIPTKSSRGDLTNRVLFSISPKLKNSVPVGTEHEKKHNKTRINEVVLEGLLKRYPAYLKFVVSDESDMDEILEITKKLKVPSHMVFLMAEGITREQIHKKAAVVNELCIKYGMRYSPRAHIDIYDNKRKV